MKQIITGTVCHLEAAMVQNALDSWHLHIENVGNLVCPSSYDLGEDLRFVLLSVTEGEDKPLKYPTIFNSADVAIITKSDLAIAVEFDEDAARRNETFKPSGRAWKFSSFRPKPGKEWLNISSFLKAGECAHVPPQSKDK